jgi:hypothetical protein
MNLDKSFDSGLGKNMHKSARSSGSVNSSNPHHLRGWRLHHHGGGVCCAFVLCVVVLSGHRYVDKYRMITLR